MDKRKPASRKKPPSTEDAKKLIDEEAPPLPFFTIDASGPSELGAQDVATWTAASGWTPIEFLTHAYRNPWQKMPDRIAAAKAVLEYNHRKLPTNVEVDLQSRNLTLDANALSALSDKELALLEKLLEKAGASRGD